MNKVIHIKDNIISRKDQHKLESFGSHTIVHGRATRWHWSYDDTHEAVFEIFRGGANEQLAIRVYRDRKHDIFNATDDSGKTIVSGTLDHVMSALDKHFMLLHGEHNS